MLGDYYLLAMLIMITGFGCFQLDLFTIKFPIGLYFMVLGVINEYFL